MDSCELLQAEDAALAKDPDPPAGAECVQSTSQPQLLVRKVVS